MLQESVAAAYTAMNLLLAVVVYLKSGKNVVARFYLFCIICLTYFGVIGYLFRRPGGVLLGDLLEAVAVFIYALLPFFFLHFIVMFIRRYEVLRSKFLVVAIYFAGLFSYAMIQAHLIPVPIVPEQGLSQIGYIYFFTWMSIFFCIGVALLYSTIEFFFKRRVRSRLLFTGFAVLMLLLPSPFTESIWYAIFRQNVEWFFSTSMVALGVSVYFIFRHKIIADTPYDAVKSALMVMNDIIIKTNQDFEIEMAKGAVSSLLGYEEKELIGKPLGMLVKETAPIDSYLEYVRTGRMEEALVDLEVHSKTGERLFMNFSFSPLMEAGEATGFVAVGRNVSEQRKLEEHVRQAQKIESIGTLASGISHDFNNILTIIQGYIDLLEREGGKSRKFSQSVEAIKSVTRRGDRPGAADTHVRAEDRRRAGVRRPERPGRGRRQDAERDLPEDDRVLPQTRSSPSTGHREHQPAPAGAAQPLRQRPGRDAAGRKAHDTDGLHRRGRAAGPFPGGGR